MTKKEKNEMKECTFNPAYVTTNYSPENHRLEDNLIYS